MNGNCNENVAYGAMRIVSALLLLATLSSCSDSQKEAYCVASRNLYQKALAAMCVPWSEKRESALADLIEAARDPDFEEAVTGFTISDYVGDIEQDDCVAAGFPNPGPKSADPRRERMREMIRAVPPPPLPPEKAKAFRESFANAPKCDLLTQEQRSAFERRRPTR